MPAPTSPTFYQSLIPQESFEDAAGYLKRIQEETGKIQGQRYQEVGTPAELGARMAGRRLQEIGSYEASLPAGDKYLRQTTGVTDPYASARDATGVQKSYAKDAYNKAMERVNEVPTATISETPSWATRPDSTWAIKEQEKEKETPKTIALADLTSAEIKKALREGTYRAATAENPTSIGQYSKTDLQTQFKTINQKVKPKK
jgi:hypothetical protein